MIEQWISWAQTSPFTPILIIAIYLAGTFTFFPSVMLFILSIHFFGPFTGSLYAIAGISCSGALSFLLGRQFGLGSIEKLPLPKSYRSGIERLNSSMQDKGFWWVAALRNAPVAPFVVVNFALGTTTIRFFDFLFGNVLGVAPTILAIIFFEEKVITAVENKDFSIAAPALLILATLYVISSAARKALDKSSTSTQ